MYKRIETKNKCDIKKQTTTIDYKLLIWLGQNQMQEVYVFCRQTLPLPCDSGAIVEHKNKPLKSYQKGFNSSDRHKAHKKLSENMRRQKVQI